MLLSAAGLRSARDDAGVGLCFAAAAAERSVQDDPNALTAYVRNWCRSRSLHSSVAKKLSHSALSYASPTPWIGRTPASETGSTPVGDKRPLFATLQHRAQPSCRSQSGTDQPAHTREGVRPLQREIDRGKGTPLGRRPAQTRRPGAHTAGLSVVDLVNWRDLRLRQLVHELLPSSLNVAGA